MSTQIIIEKYAKDKGRLMDILTDIVDESGHVSKEAVSLIAEQLNMSEVDVIQTGSFYHFYPSEAKGKYVVYVNNSAVAKMMGSSDVSKAFKDAAAQEEGLLGVCETADIGMNDQEPAALINGVPFTNLTADKVKTIVEDMKGGKSAQEMVAEFGDGNNSSEFVKSMVNNNIRKEGEVIFKDFELGSGIKKAIALTPEKVIDEVKQSNIKGRGGAGFPTGLKWNFCKSAEGDVKYVLCNADEGEPGTFKDRVLLTEKAQMMLEGMVIGGYAIGAQEGIVYLRGEYKYLKAHLEESIEKMRVVNLLGNNIAGKQGFNFDIRVQLGAGAYVCGEETALIESIEGKRGEPRNKPPFPAQVGYKGKPTVVNNVETFCAISKIVEKGGAWYNGIGTSDSTGTKVLSISGDCKNPGVYEIAWGMTLKEMIEMAGADVANTQAVQVAGPSGSCIPPSQFDRKIATEDLPTGGSMIIVGNQRNILKDLSLNFMEFMMDESCGSCTPCRGLNVLLKEKLEKVIDGKGISSDITDMEEWCDVITKTTRCGLGQTSSNPIQTTIKNFREKYEELVKDVDYSSDFDLEKSVSSSCEYVDRKPNL